VLLPVPQPYDFALSTARFRAFGVDRANLWHEGALHRVVGGVEVRIEAVPGGVDVEPWSDAVAAEVGTLLGLPFDLEAFVAWAGGDPVLAGLVVALPGFRPPLSPDPWEALVTSITAQQVSLQSAFAIRSRLIDRFGEPAEHAAAFPTRDRLARASEPELVAVGFSGRKAEYVVGLARAELELESLPALSDPEVKAALVAIRGLGEWSADWFLARHLGRAHAWPAGDLALVKAVRAFYGEIPDMRTFGEQMNPFQNLAAHHLLTGHRLVPPA